MPDRDAFDGQPFYCTVCGSGWNEHGACEEPDCKLETEATAKMRAQRRRPQGSDCADALKRSVAD